MRGKLIRKSELHKGSCNGLNLSSSAGIAVSFSLVTPAPKASPLPLLKEAAAEFKASYQFSMIYNKLTSFSLPSALSTGADSHLPAEALHTAMFLSAQKD